MLELGRKFWSFSSSILRYFFVLATLATTVSLFFDILNFSSRDASAFLVSGLKFVSIMLVGLIISLLLFLFRKKTWMD
jgi:hypothetical protein